MDPGSIGGWAGGMAGGVMGLLGGLVGTYFSIKNTKGPRERALMIKASVGCWVFVALFIAALVLIPAWYNMLVVFSYVVILVLGIRKLNEAQLRIRNEESDSHRVN